MDSYVTLTLNDYNDLYDRASAYERLTRVDIQAEPVEDIEEPVENTGEWDVILTQSYCSIPKGAKGKDLEPGNIYPFIAWDDSYENTYNTDVDGIYCKNVYSVPREFLKSINEREEN